MTVMFSCFAGAKTARSRKLRSQTRARPPILNVLKQITLVNSLSLTGIFILTLIDTVFSLALYCLMRSVSVVSISLISINSTTINQLIQTVAVWRGQILVLF